MSAGLIDVAPGLWVWRLEYPDWARRSRRLHAEPSLKRAAAEHQHHPDRDGAQRGKQEHADHELSSSLKIDCCSESCRANKFSDD